VPKPAVVRRRRAAVLAAAGLAFVAGASYGASRGENAVPPAALVQEAPDQATPTPTPTATPEPVDDLSLREQVGKLVVLRF
jgi:hypothetical protein